MRRKCIYAIVGVMVSVLIMLSTVTKIEMVNAAYLGENKVEEENEVNCIITEKLQNYVQKSRSNYVPVTIQIKSETDLAKIEEIAMKNCDITNEDLQYMEAYAETLSEDDNIQYQKQLLKVYDEIRAEKNRLLKEHYSKINSEFVERMGWDESDYESIGVFTPFIRGVDLTVDEIYNLAESGEISLIDYTSEVIYNEENDNINVNVYADAIDYQDVEDRVAIIRGNVAKNSGYTGSGVRVGVVEKEIPYISKMGNDGENITFAQSGPFSDHTTAVCGIIKNMAPNCYIYAFSLTGFNETGDRVIKACEKLISDYDVHVINISYGEVRSGEYNASSAEMDILVREYDVTIVAATGNNDNSNSNVSDYAISPNVIAVGAVESSGTVQSASGAYSQWWASCASESTGIINKPDICAPGAINIYNYNNIGTSFAAPHITGTIVQMIARNAGMGDKPTVLM